MKRESLAKIIGIIARQNRIYLVKEMNKIGVSGTEYIFIANIPDYEFTTQQKICNEFEFDSAFATRGVNSLVKKGLVEKVKSKEDTRSFEIKLTDEGRKIKKSVNEKLEYWTNVLGENFPSLIDGSN
jgi:DNA-binding MarR family transcriptional regulator